MFFKNFRITHKKLKKNTSKMLLSYGSWKFFFLQSCLPKTAQKFISIL